MVTKILQSGDLASTSFTNNNTANAGGVKVRVDAGSEVGDAIADAVADLTGIVVADSAPASPSIGTGWYDSGSAGRLFVWDGAEWVDASPAGSGGSSSKRHVGDVFFTMRSTLQSDELALEGQAVSSTTFAALKAALGIADNGNGTFTLPDGRAEFLRGLDNGRGVDIGRVMGSSQADMFKSHTHTQETNATGTSGINGGSPEKLFVSNTTATGATGGAETRPRNIAARMCIQAL